MHKQISPGRGYTEGMTCEEFPMNGGGGGRGQSWGALHKVRVTKVPHHTNNENKGQTVAQDLKITIFRKLMSLNMAYDRYWLTIVK